MFNKIFPALKSCAVSTIYFCLIWQFWFLFCVGHNLIDLYWLFFFIIPFIAFIYVWLKLKVFPLGVLLGGFVGLFIAAILIMLLYFQEDSSKYSKYNDETYAPKNFDTCFLPAIGTGENGEQDKQINQIEKAYGKKNYHDVVDITSQVINELSAKANEERIQMKDFAWESREKIFSYYFVNKVGLALYFQGKAYRALNKKDEAKVAFKQLSDKFFYAQCYNKNGGGAFLKPAKDGAQILVSLESEKQ